MEHVGASPFVEGARCPTGASPGPVPHGVCEVENRFVLELLVDALEPLGRDYGLVHADTRSRAAGRTT